MKQIENILKDYDELKVTFEPLGYLGLLGVAQPLDKIFQFKIAN